MVYSLEVMETIEI